MTWEDVGAVAMALPGVAPSTSYGTPAYKAGKALLVRLKEDGESVVLFMGLDEKEMLIEAAPEVFFQTDHYRGYPAVLARLGALQAPELRRIVEATYRAKAPKALLRTWDAQRSGGG